MRWRRIASCILLVAAFVGCREGGGGIVIGVIAPRSGPLADTGAEVRKGATLAAESINRRGGIGGKKIRIESRLESDPASTGLTIRDLIRRSSPSALIGPVDTSSIASRNSAPARSGLPLFSVGGTAGEVANPFVYDMAPAAKDEAAVLARWLVDERRLTHATVVYSPDAWGRAGAQLFEAALRRRGAPALSSHELGDTPDQTSLARSLSGTGADSLVIWARGRVAATMVQAVRAVGWSVQIAGPDALFEGGFRSLAGPLSDDVAIVLPYYAPEVWFGRDLREWFIDYHRRFSLLPIAKQQTLVTDLPLAAIEAYDAVNLVARAITEAGSTDPRAVGTALDKTQAFQGVLKSYSFGPHKHHAFVVSEIRPARFFNLALIYDVAQPVDAEQQIAFYKVQVSAYYVPDAYLRTASGKELVDKVLEQVLSDPEKVEFFRSYEAPKPPPGPLR